MLRKILISLPILLAQLFACPSSAQIALSENFWHKLEKTGLFFMEPVEGKYKTISKMESPFQRYDFAIRSRVEKMEIRYLLEPWNENNPLSALPNIRASQLVTHLASNQGEGLVIGQNIGQETLLEDFNADWGKVFYFEPKDQFSLAGECKLLVLHKAGAGTAFVFFLYDKITVELDRRFVALQFK